MLELLKKLCEINGASGDEDHVAEFIIANISTEGAVIRRDNLGNVLVFKKGRKTPSKLVMFAAHMDEVGFIITGIDSNGYLRFGTVGGIMSSAVFGRKIKFKNGVTGVIAGKPVHMLTQKEKDTQPKIDDLLIDIGASSKSESETYVNLGDYAYFENTYSETPIGDTKAITAKAIDNRLGCAIMLSMLKSVPEYDCVFAFTVQEEIGCRGAAVATFNLEPEICIALEATTACDTAGVSGENKVCELDKGPVISYMDKGTAYDRGLYNIATTVAKENDIQIQTKTKIVGGNDASVIHKSAGGVRTLAISAPCRYIHTPHCRAYKNTLFNMQTLSEKLLISFSEID
ncbi:MAG: M42 family peptidase [Oscillospiraceae bacterium]|nr:M42 family peptidase [Oscillospiraceae bacterium]